MRKLSLLILSATLAGCSASSEFVQTVTLKTSGVKIDIVQSRSDVRLADCSTLVVLQTYSAEGRLIDSKEARGQSLLCDSVPALIEAGGRVGAAAVVRPAVTKISNSVQGSSAEAGATAVGLGGSASATGGSASSSSTSGSSSSATGGQGGQGGQTNHDSPGGGGHGNNGFGNGGGDGSPNGHDDSNR